MPDSLHIPLYRRFPPKICTLQWNLTLSLGMAGRTLQFGITIDFFLRGGQLEKAQASKLLLCGILNKTTPLALYYIARLA